MPLDVSTKELIEAITHNDIEAFELARSGGASVNDNHPDKPGQSWPIWWDALTRYGYFSSARNSIYEQILTDAVDINVPEHDVLSIALSRVAPYNEKISSFAVLATIRESGGCILPDYRQIFSRVGEDENPHHERRVKLKKCIQSVLERTSHRLKSPVTRLEREASGALVEEARSIWTNPMVIPDLADLPLPTAFYNDADKRANEACLQSSEALRRSKETMQECDYGVYLSNVAEYDQAVESMAALRDMELISVTVPKTTKPAPKLG